MNAEEDEASSDLIIRGLPASVRKILAARAKARGMPLNDYLIELLTLYAEMPEAAEVAAS